MRLMSLIHKKTQLLQCVSILFAVLLFSGCVVHTYHSSVGSSEAPTKSTGYVFGRFAFDSFGFWKVCLEITNLGTGEKKYLELQKRTKVIAIKMPAGRYQIKNIMFSKSGHIHMSGDYKMIPFDAIPFSTPFAVKSGSAVYIGDFYGSTKAGGAFSEMGGIDHVQYRFDETTKEFLQKHPGFRDVEIYPAFY